MITLIENENGGSTSPTFLHNNPSGKALVAVAPVLTFVEKFNAARSKVKHRIDTYNRKEACSLVGFYGKSPAFTCWLKDNSFLSDDDYPHQLLLDDKIMAVREKEICHGTKIVYTPLFTYAGIRYFTRILLEPTFLYEQKLKLDEHTKMSYNGPRLI